MRFRAAYDGLAAIVSLESGLGDFAPSKTQQQFADEVDINTIVRRFGVTGQVPAPVNLPTYEDFSHVVDFQTAMQLVRQSAEEFATLPATVRDRFNNDPGQLLEFLGDVRNRDEAVRLGLIESPSPPPVAAVAATTPPAS